MTSPVSPARCLVLAKAPVAGRVKTRLGAHIGMDAAATIAAASLSDTLAACTAAFGSDRCHLALDGDLANAVDGPRIAAALEGWTVFGQHGSELASRLAQAHAAMGQGPVLQIGMDTPQTTVGVLRAAAEGLRDHDAVLGPAADGGWWALALRDPGKAAALLTVPMSTPETFARTKQALEGVGLRVALAPTLRDVDTATDAEAVAGLVPDGRFARAWTLVKEQVA